MTQKPPMTTSQQKPKRAKPGPKPSGKRVSGADRVQKSRAKTLTNGYQRADLVLPPEAVQALQTLMQRNPSATKVGCITSALVAAAKACE